MTVRTFNNRHTIKKIVCSTLSQVVPTWMGNCLLIGKPSQYITNTKVNSAFHPSGVGKSSTCLSSWGYDRVQSPVLGGMQVTMCDPIWQLTLRSSDTSFP